MDEQFKQQISDIAKSVFQSEMMNAFSNPSSVLYPHRHTGNDMPKVYADDLEVRAGIGFILPVTDTGLPPPQLQNQYEYDFFTDGSGLVLEPNLAFHNGSVPATLSIGKDSFRLFNTISINISGPTVDTPNLTIITHDETTSTDSEIAISPDLVHFEVAAGLVGSATSELSFDMQEWTTTGDFVLKIPQTATLPVPIPGMIAFDGSDFRGVDSGGTWKTFTLV